MPPHKINKYKNKTNKPRGYKNRPQSWNLGSIPKLELKTLMTMEQKNVVLGRMSQNPRMPRTSSLVKSSTGYIQKLVSHGWPYRFHFIPSPKELDIRVSMAGGDGHVCF